MNNTAKNLVVLGAGTAGTMVVNKLRKVLPATEWTITVCDQNDTHDYQPGYLFVPFDMNTPEEIRRTTHPFIHDGIQLLLAEVARIEPEANLVHLTDGRALPYDQLVIASGTTSLRCAANCAHSRAGGWSSTSPKCRSSAPSPPSSSPFSPTTTSTRRASGTGSRSSSSPRSTAPSRSRWRVGRPGAQGHRFV